MSRSTSRTSSDRWVFAYGSLMWRPEFSPAEAVPARLSGFHRAFCIYSVHYRGSRRRPGLVLGLDRGGTCDGIAFRLEAETAGAVLAQIRDRELIYGVYREAQVSVTLHEPGRPAVPAVTYIAERAHWAYAGRLAPARQVALIRGASGSAGANLDYLINTLGHLTELGIREPRLDRLLSTTGSFAARGPVLGLARPRVRSLAACWGARAMAFAPVRMGEVRGFHYRARLASQDGRGST